MLVKCYDNFYTAVTFNNLHLKLLSTQGIGADKLHQETLLLRILEANQLRCQ